MSTKYTLITLNTLEIAAGEIANYCAKFGRIQISQAKEKYGTVRVYCYFGMPSIHALLYPLRQYKHPKWPKWLWTFDVYYGDKLLYPLNLIMLPWQRYVYRKAYKLAIKKYPLFKHEILMCADYPELLKRL